MIKVNTSDFKYQRDQHVLMKTHRMLLVNWQTDFELLISKINQI